MKYAILFANILQYTLLQYVKINNYVSSPKYIITTLQHQNSLHYVKQELFTYTKDSTVYDTEPLLTGDHLNLFLKLNDSIVKFCGTGME